MNLVKRTLNWIRAVLGMSIAGAAAAMTQIHPDAYLRGVIGVDAYFLRTYEIPEAEHG